MRRDGEQIHFDPPEAWAMSTDPLVPVSEVPDMLVRLADMATHFIGGANALLSDAAHPELHKHGHVMNDIAGSITANSQKLHELQ